MPVIAKLIFFIGIFGLPPAVASNATQSTLLVLPQEFGLFC